MTDPRASEIAAKLTPARKHLILSLPDDGSWGRAPDRRVAVRLWWSDLTLIDHKYRPESPDQEWRLNDLGLAVLAALTKGPTNE